MTKNKSWWGEFHFDPLETKCWRIGDRVIAVKRNKHEWTVWNKETDVESDQPTLVEAPKPSDSFQDSEFHRYILNTTNGTLIIEPSLADRAMVIRPNKPFTIMPEEEIKIYVSSPLWMTILAPDSKMPISDIPFWRPSDSWFGPSTMSGDLCYSKYTDAKMEKELIEKRSHRATTIVTIKNAQEEPLYIERLNLPTPALRLYSDQEGELWTDQIFITQHIEHSKSVSHVRHTSPENITNLKPISESRESSNKASFLSSIKSLVS